MKKILLIGLLAVLLVGCWTEPITVPINRLTTESNSLPITTWEHAFELAIVKFGSEEIWNCQGVDSITSPERLPLNLPVDEHGYYGYPGKTTIDGETKITSYVVFFECLQVTEWRTNNQPASAVTVLDFTFDPNNGWISELICNQDYREDCPMVNGEFVYIRQFVDANPDREKYMALT